VADQDGGRKWGSAATVFDEKLGERAKQKVVDGL